LTGIVMPVRGGPAGLERDVHVFRRLYHTAREGKNGKSFHFHVL
jgi:hypothetical protein